MHKANLSEIELIFGMGGQVSKIMGRIFGSKEMRLLMLGLDAAGKTSTFSAGKHSRTAMLISRQQSFTS